jgi:hypothetical protein
MSRFFCAAVTGLALTAASSTAHAAVGFTAHQTWDYGTHGFYASPFVLPTLDYASDGLILQAHVLELLAGASNSTLDLGVNLYKTVSKKKVTDDINGVLQAGAKLNVASGADFDVANGSLGLILSARLGAQASKGIGFGMYVVPDLGVAKTGDEIELVVGGGLQVSAWMKKLDV